MSDLSLSKGNYICVFSHDGTRLVTTNSSLQLGGSNSSNVIHCETPESFQLPPIATGQGKLRLPCWRLLSTCLSISVSVSVHYSTHLHSSPSSCLYTRPISAVGNASGVTSLILAGSHTFVENDHEIFSSFC